MTESLEQAPAAVIGLLPRLRRFARTLAHDADEADDIVVNAIARALADWEHAPIDREPWLFGLVRGAALTQTRTARPSLADTHHESSVVAELQALPEEQRTAIALVLIEGLSYAQAARAMDLPVGTLTSRLARGREALQAVL